MDVNKKDIETLLKINMELTEECDKLRAALEAISGLLCYEDEDSLTDYIMDNIDDAVEDYIGAHNLAKHALEGDEE
jgi:hypothetical protein